jgi:hypothetical protein
MRAWVRDPGLRAVGVLAAVAVGGLAGLVLAWRGAAASLDVSVQVPFVVSGAFGGIALTGASLALLAIHLDRRATAGERAVLDDAIAEVAAMTEEALR